MRGVQSALARSMGVAVVSMIAIGTMHVGVAAAQPPVAGPNGPELGCLSTQVEAALPLRCEVTGFQPGTPIAITVSGRAGILTTVLPTAEGNGAFTRPWPFAGVEAHAVVATQRNADGVLEASTQAERSKSTIASPKRVRRSSTTSTARKSAEAEAPDIELPPGKSQVPLRVSAAIGLGAVALVILAVRRRRRTRFGL